MSQYPSPYPPPPYGYSQQTYWDPTRDLLAPARRAAMLMFIYGGLLLVCGGCVLTSAGMLRSQQTVQRMREMFPGMEIPSPRQTAFQAIVPFVTGILLVLLGTRVRGGSRGGMIAAIVLASLILLLQLLGVLIALVVGTDAVTLAGEVCGSVLFVVGPFTLLIVWLVQALRNTAQVDAANAYAQQYWQYGQPPYPPPGYGPQGYPQQGYPPQGYPQASEGGMIPAPPPPPMPPPPPSPPSEPPSQA